MSLSFDITTMSELASKVSKRLAFPLRASFLLFISIFGLFIFFVCIKQRATLSKSVVSSSVFSNIGVHCDASVVSPKESLHIHFPRPKTYSRKECQCNPVRYFAIMSMQRSGSGWFETLLNSHPNISSNGEIFSIKERRANISTIFRTMDIVFNLDWISSSAKNECLAAVGFKWMLNQAVMDYHREIANYVNWKGVSLVFLFRRNLLRRLVSELANAYDRSAKLLNGTHKSHVHSKEEAEILARYKPTIDIETMIPKLRHSEQLMADSLRFFNTTHRIIVYYEDILKNQEILSDVQGFLGIPYWRLGSHQVKIHSKPLSEQVENWSDVCNVLAGTNYERFLSDSDPVPRLML